jgi:hypothetical protein
MLAASATSGPWLELRLLVTVKAYPSVSTKYGEAICVAGVRLDTPTPEWVRLFPVRFRDLPRDQQFVKYEVITVLAQKHSSDRRIETWRPQQESIRRHEFIDAGGPWLARRRHLEPLLGPTMCGLHRGRKGGQAGASLGLIRPARLRGIRVRLEDEWSVGQQSMVGQGSLITTKAELVKPAHAFSYSYFCEEPGCNGHIQKIVDWELGEAYRSWRYSGDELVDVIKTHWSDFMCADKREPLFFVGDQHTRPGQFLVLGTFYPERRPDEAQLALDIAA